MDQRGAQRRLRPNFADVAIPPRWQRGYELLPHYDGTSKPRYNVISMAASTPPEDPPAEKSPVEDQATPAEDPYDFSGQKVFVAGATGRTGRKVVEKLVKEKVPVVAFVRDLEAAKSKLPSEEEGVTIVQGDITKYETIQGKLDGCTAVINAAATNSFLNPTNPFQIEYQGTKNLLAAAQQTEVKKFVIVTVIGADELLSPFNLFGGLSLFKKLAEDEVQRSGLNYTIVRPGGLIDEVGERELGGVSIGPRGYYGLSGKKMRPRDPILRSAVADLCVDSIVDSNATDAIIEIATEKDSPQRGSKELFTAAKST